jgi:hypothetical protein
MRQEALDGDDARKAAGAVEPPEMHRSHATGSELLEQRVAPNGGARPTLRDRPVDVADQLLASWRYWLHMAGTTI